jgi:hypothetical protein
LTGDPVSIFGGRLPSSFERRRVVLPPGSSRPYRDEEWRDALVTIDSGDLELECLRGGHRTFAAGAILWFSDLGLKTMHNRGPIPTVLVAISRRTR